MKRRRQQSAPVAHTDPQDALVIRARTARRRGDSRKALHVLREAAYSHQMNARLWTLYGVQCASVGKLDDAMQALGHAAWLREARPRHAPRRG